MPYRLGNTRSAANGKSLLPRGTECAAGAGKRPHRPCTGIKSADRHGQGSKHRTPPRKIKTDSLCEGLSAECGEISGVELQEGGGQAFKERLID